MNTQSAFLAAAVKTSERKKKTGRIGMDGAQFSCVIVKQRILQDRQRGVGVKMFDKCPV